VSALVRTALLFVCVICILGVAGCAPSPTVPPKADVSAPTPQETGLSELDIPQDAIRTAAPASATQAGAAMIRTDAPASFYVVRPNVDNWFEIDQDARVLGWSSSPGTEVGIYLVSEEGSRTAWDISGYDQPLYTPDPDVDSGNAAGRRYLSPDQTRVGPAWLVIVPRAWDNESTGVVGLQVTSSFR